MKKITTACAAVVLAFFQLLPASAQSEVHLTFLRSGTNASDVTVYVKDGNGNTISGASATLEKVEKGQNNTFTTKDIETTTFLTGGNMATYTDILCASYNNQNSSSNDFTQFTFKITGLDDFAYRDIAMRVAGINSGGQFQMKMDRYFDFRVWNISSNISADNSLCATTKNNVTDNGTNNQAGNDNTKDYTLKGSTVNFANSAEQYIIVRFTNTAQGCFIGLREITLKQMTYSVTPTETNNLGKVATFSAGTNVKFDANTTAYIATENGTSSVKLSKLSGDVLEAGKGAVLITTGTTITATPTSKESADSRTNYLEGSGDATKELTASNYYILNLNSSNNAVFSLLGSTNTTLAANKAALAIGSGGSNALSINFEGSTTGIGTATTGIATSSSRIYNLQGQAVTGKLAKGVYVQGGKKFIVK